MCGSRRLCELPIDVRLDLEDREPRRQRKKSARALARSTASALRAMATMVPMLSGCGSDGSGDALEGSRRVTVTLTAEVGAKELVADKSARALAEVDGAADKCCEEKDDDLDPLRFEPSEMLDVVVDVGNEGDVGEFAVAVGVFGEVEGELVDVARVVGLFAAPSAGVAAVSSEQPRLTQGPKFTADEGRAAATEHQHFVSDGWHGEVLMLTMFPRLVLRNEWRQKRN